MTDYEIEEMINGLNEEPKIPLELGQIIVHDGTSCRAFLYQYQIVAPDHTIISLDCLQKIKVIENSPVFFDGKIVGKLKANILSSMDNSLNALFVLDEDAEDYSYIKKNQRQFMVLPHLNPKRIGCVLCNNYYDSGQTPCQCIYESEYIMLSNTHIIGMTLFDLVNDDIEKIDNRQSLLRQFFGGAMSELLITEPI